MLIHIFALSSSFLHEPFATMEFSGAVRLVDIDDYIGPSQACIKPMMEGSEENKAEAKLALKLDGPVDTHFDQIRTTARETAKITLNDCLACSGCVTSAEAVLIEQQSSGILLSHLKERTSKHFVALCSPQSIASIAVKYNITLLQALGKLNTYLRSIGVDYIFDTNFGLLLAIEEAKREFIKRYRNAENLPVLSGECPGWVCYAEKTQHQAIPLISEVKSPQQIMASVVRKHLSTNLGCSSSDLFVFAVMPCFDKKLEASRDDLVDLVLSTKEVEDMVGVGFEKLETSNVDSVLCSVSKESDKLLTAALNHAGSGGYLESIYRAASKEVYGIDIPIDQQLEYKSNKRNPDFAEVTLEINGNVEFRFAKAYGFRNIQNLMRKLKGNEVYHYIEVMACPSGCLNGGGQIPAALSHTGRKSIKAQKELITKIESLFHESVVIDNRSIDLVKDIDQSEFHTTFQAVPEFKMEGNLNVKW